MRITTVHHAYLRIRTDDLAPTASDSRLDPIRETIMTTRTSRPSSRQPAVVTHGPGSGPGGDPRGGWAVYRAAAGDQ
jgi:hypothetical protein